LVSRSGPVLIDVPELLAVLIGYAPISINDNPIISPDKRAVILNFVNSIP
jgi:hypothetical protein